NLRRLGRFIVGIGYSHGQAFANKTDWPRRGPQSQRWVPADLIRCTMTKLYAVNGEAFMLALPFVMFDRALYDLVLSISVRLHIVSSVEKVGSSSDHPQASNQKHYASGNLRNRAQIPRLRENNRAPQAEK